MAIKIIFKKMDAQVHLPRKVKDDKKKEITERLQRSSLEGLYKIIIGKHTNAHDRDYAIYGEGKVEYDKIFPSIKTTTNYFAGSICHDTFFLVEIGELVDVQGKFEMMDFPKEKIIYVQLKSIL